MSLRNRERRRLDIATDEPKAQVFANNNGQTLEIIVKDTKQPELVAKAMGTRLSAEGTPLRELVIGRYEIFKLRERE